MSLLSIPSSRSLVGGLLLPNIIHSSAFPCLLLYLLQHMYSICTSTSAPAPDIFFPATAQGKIIGSGSTHKSTAPTGSK